MPRRSKRRSLQPPQSRACWLPLSAGRERPPRRPIPRRKRIPNRIHSRPSEASNFGRARLPFAWGASIALPVPHLPWDAQYDFFGMTHSVIVLDLQIDPTGQVISAIITKSSGSDGVDQACRVAAYEWWFEPAKDSAGHRRSRRDHVHDKVHVELPIAGQSKRPHMRKARSSLAGTLADRFSTKRQAASSEPTRPGCV